MELAPTRWNKRKHVNNDWMLLILVTVNPLDGLRSAVTKKVAQILTQSNFELLHAWKFTCHLKKDHCQKEISATGDIPRSLAAWVRSIPHLREAKQYPVATKTTCMIQSFHLSLLRKYMLVLSNLLLKKTHLKDHFYLSNRKNLLGQRFQEPRLYCSKTLAPNCFLQIKAASTHLAVPISSVSTWSKTTRTTTRLSFWWKISDWNIFGSTFPSPTPTCMVFRSENVILWVCM